MNLPKTKVVIIGGGFGGLSVAQQLSKCGGDQFEVELINGTNYFVFQPLLPEVAAGGITAADAVAPLRMLLPNAKIRMAAVRGVDFQTQTVNVLQGTKRSVIPVHYDHLVLAPGQAVDMGWMPGMSDHAFTMKNLADAYRLRNHVIDCLEHADITERPETKERLLTFVVVGAGFSGVETVGEMRDLLDGALRYYPRIEKKDLRTVLIEHAPRILGELPESLAAYAQRKLVDRDIEILLSTAVESATATGIKTSEGKTINTSTIVGTVGNGPTSLVLDLPLDKSPQNKICVDRNLRVNNFTNVWALGDSAQIPMTDGDAGQVTYAPPTAQFAVREAKTVARNICASVRDESIIPFSFKPSGKLASIGGHRAVAEIFGVRISGFIAWILWRSLYLGMLPGFATKVRVAVSWLLDHLIPRNTVQLQQQPATASRYIHYRAGDEVFEAGMLADGFYTVVSGSFELIIDQNGMQEPVTKTIGPGEHFGERVLFVEGSRTGSVRALEDAKVFFINRDDFKRFTKAFKVLDDYFEEYISNTFPDGVTAAPKPKPD